MLLTNEMSADKKEYLRTQLTQKAHDQGAVTFDDILALLPDAERDIALLDDLMDNLSDMGVAIVSKLPPDLAAGDDQLPGLIEGEFFEDEEDGFGPIELEDDLVDDAGYQQALDTDDVVGLYLKEAGRVPLLTADEEVSLAKRMEAAVIAKQALDDYADSLSEDDVYDLRQRLIDGELAQEHLIRANARLVISVAKKYIGRGVPFLDLIQEGNLGLMKSVEKFDYRRGFRFSTYATWWSR